MDMSINNDKYDLMRFEQAQIDCYDHVKRELTRGRKQTHWMWYIFPQLAHLGQSETSQYYGISCLNEARAYLDHPLLGSRLQECFRLVNSHTEQDVGQIFGWPDDLKFHSCLTLFEQAIAECSDLSNNSNILADIQRALSLFYAGEPDQKTLRMLHKISR